MSQFRITRCIVRGPYANAECFEKWLEGVPADVARLVTVRDEPGIPPGGIHDARYYLWVQEKPVDTSGLKCQSDPGLVTHAGKNWWFTQAEAQAVIDAKLAKAAAVDAQVKAANAAAVSPGNIASGVASDVAAAAAKAAEAAGAAVLPGLGVVGLVAGVVAVGAVGYVAYQLLKRR